MAVLVSHVSILVPFSLGSLLALLLYPLVSSGTVSFTAFALFLGAAMSITAFPVLARIITENNLQNTRLGTMALTIANPNSQKGLLELAVTIALGATDQSLQLPPAAIYPLSLVQLDEEYAFGGTPAEAERLIAERERQLAALIASLEPPLVRPLVHPIVRIATDVAQETARIADGDRADLILMGWHRPAFSRNRLGGRVGQILSTARTDVAVFVDRQHAKLEHLLVPYVSDLHNDLGLEIAFRILVNSKNCSLTILSLTQSHQANDLTYEFRTLMEQLPASVRDCIHTPKIESNHPIAAVVEASARADLTIAGASREWGLERQTLGFYADQLAVECHSSLLITRRYSQVTAHLSSG
ncbi:MAG: universal stress protein [Stenomitos frigidus ULC029]